MTVVPSRNWKRHMPTIGSVESDTRFSDAPSLPTSHDCRCSLAFGSASVLLHCAAAVAVSNAPASTRLSTALIFFQVIFISFSFESFGRVSRILLDKPRPHNTVGVKIR
jgi:hypothetical protein